MTKRYRPVTTSRNTSNSTEIADPSPKFQLTNEFPKMWIEMRSADFGGVAPNRTNGVLKSLNVHRNSISSSTTLTGFREASVMWRTWPFALLCITAGLQNVPTEMYEAAAIDGAGFWRRLTAVTLPSLRPINQVLLLVLFLWTFNDFNTPYVLFGGSAPPEADLISIHIYNSSFSTWDFGMGSAMSVVLLLFLLLVTAVYLMITNRRRIHA